LQAIDPPFNPREEALEDTAQYLSKWFTTDEGLEADPDTIEAVGMFQDQVLGGIELQAQIKGAIAMAGQPPPPMPPSGGTPDKKKKSSGAAVPGALASAGG